MATVRPPAVAGAFYPSPAGVLADVVDEMVAQVEVPALDVTPAALIVPHAGYVYSGRVAAICYALLRDLPEPPRRFVLVGPSHRVHFPGIALSDATEWETPLGRLPVDPELRDVAAADPAVTTHHEAHAGEHSLEVQLPFLQRLADGVSILPLVTSETEPADAARVLGTLLDGPGVFALLSSDLSHYLDYETARAKDERTAAAIVELRAEDIAWDDACGQTAVQAGLLVARERGWQCRRLDLRNSGDTAGDRSRVVGYGAFALGPIPG